MKQVDFFVANLSARWSFELISLQCDLFVADLYTGYLFILADLLNSLQGDCSIRMTALLEYLDLALAALSWISCYNSVALSLILLHH